VHESSGDGTGYTVFPHSLAIDTLSLLGPVFLVLNALLSVDFPGGLNFCARLRLALLPDRSFTAELFGFDGLSLIANF